MNIAVIFAGGMGKRMSSCALPKQFLEVHGKPVIAHTLQHFEDHPDVDRIAVAILPAWREQFSKLVRRYDLAKVSWIVDGGATGQQSRHRALQATATDCPDSSVVLIHDGVRPMINSRLISDNIDAVKQHGSAITCSKFNETVVSSASDHIDKVIPRDHIYAAQAPQSLRLGDALELYDRAVADGELDSIDTCTLMEQYGYPIFRVDGPRSNIKITTAEDFYTCRAFFVALENRQIVGF